MVSKTNSNDGFYVDSENFRKINPYSIAFVVPGTYIICDMEHKWDIMMVIIALVDFY